MLTGVSTKMELQDRETARLWRVHKTVHQMMHDRGYVISQSELDLSLTDFINTYGTGGIVAE